MNKTVDEKPIKPYLVTLKVNSKKPYKNSEASVKVVKDGKRYKLVANFKLKKPKIEVDFYYEFVVANHGVLSHLAIDGTDHQLKRLITRVLFRQRSILARPRNLAMPSCKLSALVVRWGSQPLRLRVRAITSSKFHIKCISLGQISEKSM